MVLISHQPTTAGADSTYGMQSAICNGPNASMMNACKSCCPLCHQLLLHQVRYKCAKASFALPQDMSMDSISRKAVRPMFRFSSSALMSISPKLLSSVCMGKDWAELCGRGAPTAALDLLAGSLQQAVDELVPAGCPH